MKKDIIIISKFEEKRKQIEQMEKDILWNEFEDFQDKYRDFGNELTLQDFLLYKILKLLEKHG